MPASSAAREQAIREQAYYLWEQDGRPHGRDLEYWARAAAELAVLTKRTRVSPGKAAKAASPVQAPAEPAAVPVARKPRARRTA
ncbi:MAG: DUF2934 domain-containing protein [Devosia sp.]|nr:DUF2934 domain-containing protein [Devosia sp.]